MPKLTAFQPHCRVTVGEIQVMDFWSGGLLFSSFQIHEIAQLRGQGQPRVWALSQIHLCLILSSAGSCNQIA